MKTYMLRLTDEDGTLIDSYPLEFTPAQVAALRASGGGEPSRAALEAVRVQMCGVEDAICREIAVDLAQKLNALVSRKLREWGCLDDRLPVGG
jgi:hypothetical protein